MSIFDFALENQLALAPIPGGQKLPMGIVDIYADRSADPAQWERWRAAHPDCNFVLPMLGRLVAVDIDEKNGKAGIAAWHEWRTANGLPQYLPAWTTPSGGVHILFRLPANTDPDRLRQSQLAPGIDIRAAVKSYVLCPPSVIGDGRYFLNVNPQIYDAPEALLRHVLPEHTARPPAPGATSQYDPADVQALVTFLTEQGEFGYGEHDQWAKLGMALKLQGGEEAFQIWQSTFNETVTDHVAHTKWDLFSGVPEPGCVTLMSFTKRAHELGWTGQLRRSTQDIFGNVAASVPAAPSDGANLEDFIALLRRTFTASFQPASCGHVPPLMPVAEGPATGRTPYTARDMARQKSADASSRLGTGQTLGNQRPPF